MIFKIRLTTNTPEGQDQPPRFLWHPFKVRGSMLQMVADLDACHIRAKNFRFLPLLDFLGERAFTWLQT